jgi:hypothetical protein
MADIGVFMNLRSLDREADRRKQVLERVLPGYSFDYSHGGGDYRQYDRIAGQLVARNPDARVFVASCWPTMKALNNATNLGVVYAGLTDSPTDPPYGNNDTGIKSFEPTKLCLNWPYLLKQIAPNVTRAAVIYDKDAGHPCMSDQNTAITNGISSLRLSLNITTTIDAGLDPPALKSAIDGFANTPAGPAGLIVTAGTLTAGSRLDVTRIAASNNLPVIYPNNLYTDNRKCPEAAGLISYGPDLLGLYQRAASDFLMPILHAAGTTTDIRSRFPPVPNTDFDVVVSQRAAAALSLSVPPRFTVIDDNGQPQQVAPIIVP